MAKIRHPKKSEIDYIFDMCNRIFRYEKGGWNLNFIKKQFHAFDENDILVIEKNGKIVSHLYMKPYQINICGAILKGAEVGGVATEEKYRGRGFASSLLREAIYKMKERGLQISTLGGFRDRYARWGWERGGSSRTYIISDRSVRYAGNPKNIEIYKYTSSYINMRKRLVEAYEKNEIHMIRSEIDSYLTYDVKKYSKMDIWMLFSEDDKFAYMATLMTEDRENLRILEYGGDPNVLTRGLRKAYEEMMPKEILIPTPGIHTRFTSLLEKISAGWTIHPVRQINILNLKACLKKLLPIAERDAKPFLDNLAKSYSVTLKVLETGEEATILFDVGICELSEERSKDIIVLDKCHLVRLIFGQEKPSKIIKLDKNALTYLDLIFPLPFFEWVTDTR